MTLDQLQVGSKGRIAGFSELETSFRRKLLALGLIPGAQVEVLRVAPMGDPIQVKLRGSTVSLRRSEAKTSLVEAL